mmetsp:Transcript_46425/g.61485  ORF Transcript_46425/g.61485 Transcript_46425/m.61485 type:complete len:100 (+) Transcript_46425:53-352(+)
MVEAAPQGLPVKRDYINYSADRALMSLIGNETLVYAAMVKKINLYDWSQERMLVITDQGIYNVYKKKIKRKIEIRDIGGVTKTIPPSKKLDEFTVGVPS